jgi:hypothetical protein
VSRFRSGTGHRRQEFAERFVPELSLAVMRFTTAMVRRVNRSRAYLTSCKILVEVVMWERSLTVIVEMSSDARLAAGLVVLDVSHKVHSRIGKIISDENVLFVTRKINFNKKE